MPQQNVDESCVIESVFSIGEVLNLFAQETMRRHGIGEFSGGSMIDIQRDGEGNIARVLCRISRDYDSKTLLDDYNAAVAKTEEDQDHG